MLNDWLYQSGEIIFGNPVPDTDFQSLFHFPHHCRIRDFRGFISISDTATGHFSRGEMTDAEKIMNPQHFGSDPEPNLDYCINLDLNLGSLLVDVRRRLGGGLCCLQTQSSC